MPRESDQHGPRQDDQLKHEVEGMLRGNGSARSEEWDAPEPSADDDPQVPLFGDANDQE
jgi:hypothetical protein